MFDKKKKAKIQNVSDYTPLNEATPIVKSNNKNSLWELDNSLIEVQEKGESIQENNKGFTVKAEDFGPLMEYVKDETITDIDFNGTSLWITDIYNRHWKDTKLNISSAFIRRLAQTIANSDAKEFNQKHPCLEAETDDLRISILHNSVAQTGTTLCIRKTPKKERIKEKEAIENNYCSYEVLSLLANCIKAHMNIVICGEPRAGKTECAKFISGFIPRGERVITIEDVMEWHYKALHPDADVIEMKVNSDFDYSDGIIASLKQNPRWLMIAETRGKEVKNLIQSFTTGVNGITTLHTDDVRKIPSRIVNMADDSLTAKRMENNVYEFVDVGILISMVPNKDGGFDRRIDEIAFFSNDNENNKCCVMVEGGDIYRATIPDKIKSKFKLAGIKNIYDSELIKEHLKQQGYNLNNLKNSNISENNIDWNNQKKYENINEDIIKQEKLEYLENNTSFDETKETNILHQVN